MEPNKGVRAQVTRVVRVMLLVRNENQTDLAIALGTTQANVSRKLAGKVAWTIDDIGAMASHFRIETADLFRDPAELLSLPGKAPRDLPAPRGRRIKHERRHALVNEAPVRSKWSNPQSVYDLAA